MLMHHLQTAVSLLNRHAARSEGQQDSDHAMPIKIIFKTDFACYHLGQYQYILKIPSHFFRPWREPKERGESVQTVREEEVYEGDGWWWQWWMASMLHPPTKTELESIKLRALLWAVNETISKIIHHILPAPPLTACTARKMTGTSAAVKNHSEEQTVRPQRRTDKWVGRYFGLIQRLISTHAVTVVHHYTGDRAASSPTHTTHILMPGSASTRANVPPKQDPPWHYFARVKKYKQGLFPHTRMKSPAWPFSSPGTAQCGGRPGYARLGCKGSLSLSLSFFFWGGDWSVNT